MEKFYVKNTFLTGYSGWLLLILRELDIQTFNSKYINSKSNSNNSILINFVGKLYLMSKNVDFVIMICSQDSHFMAYYYKSNFYPESLSLRFCQYTNFEITNFKKILNHILHGLYKT